MNYISTRGAAPALNFEEVILAGLAEDGGLYVPVSLPEFSHKEIASWASLDYSELMFKIIQPFIDGEIADSDVKAIIAKAYVGFRHEAIAPLVQTGRNEWILELFHGPTLAFKDFALQFLGHLLDFILAKRQQRVTVLGATSGDTGSAAIEGCRHCENIDIFILHPHNRVSDVQRQQMTTVLADNVFNIAVDGNFDDCQNIVKKCFRDQSFLQPGNQLVAVNSINWARIMAQIVYYFYAALAVGGPHRAVSFSVPTGNFGDIYAGYLAQKMGLPIKQLIIATNQNDILHRCIAANDHSKQALQHTLSPSMDIMVSSNFERMLFDLYDRDGSDIRQLMQDFKSGEMKLDEKVLMHARKIFSSRAVLDDEMLKTLAKVFHRSGYLCDPHTAIGVAAARAERQDRVTPMICLATAHPAKFPEAMVAAGEVDQPVLPQHMRNLAEREERYQVLPNKSSAIQAFITEQLA